MAAIGDIVLVKFHGYNFDPQYGDEYPAIVSKVHGDPNVIDATVFVAGQTAVLKASIPNESVATATLYGGAWLSWRAKP